MAEFMEHLGEMSEKKKEFHEFRFAHEDDAEYFRTRFAARASLDMCIEEIRERGYRDADIPVIVLKFSREHVQKDVIECIHEYPEVDIMALFRAARESTQPIVGVLTSHVAQYLDLFVAQPGCAERMVEDERLRELLVLNLPHVLNLSAAVAQRLIGEKFLWAVFGHIESFQPDAVDVPALLDVMVAQGEITERGAQSLRLALPFPERFADLVMRQRVGYFQDMVIAGGYAEEKYGEGEDEEGIIREYRQKQNAHMFRAVPGLLLWREWQRTNIMESGAEGLYALHRPHARPELARDMPEMLRECFAQTEDHFFEDDNVESLRSALEPARQVRDYGIQVPLPHPKQRAVWFAERTLLVNQPLVAQRLRAAPRFPSPEHSDPVKREELSTLLKIIALSEASENTVSEYYPLMRRIVRDENLIFPEHATHSFNFAHTDGMVEFFTAFRRCFTSDRDLAPFARMVDAAARDGSEDAHGFFERATIGILRNDGDSREYVLNSITRALPAFPDSHFPVYAEFAASAHGRWKDEALAFFHEQKIPVDNELLNVWKRCSHKIMYSQTVFVELRTMQWLEQERPGICTVLRKEFGIENHSRYPLNLLFEQFDTRDDVTRPFGIIINSKSDHNGAFRGSLLQRWDGYDPIKKLYDDVSPHYALRVYEAGSKIDFVRMLSRIKRRYINPSEHKISFAFIGGHGAPDGIAFGNQHDIGDITVDDLKGKGAATLGGAYFEPGATIILRSCSTGVESGIGQQLSKTLGLQLIAPDIPTNIQSISVDMPPDAPPRFFVKFYAGESRRYNAGLPVRAGE